MCSALHREQTAAMNIFEIPERKLVSGFGRFGMGLIDPEMPFAVLSETVRANELVLVLRHRMMISPRIFLINDNTPLSDYFFSISERGFVWSYRPALSKRNRGAKNENPDQ